MALELGFKYISKPFLWRHKSQLLGKVNKQGGNDGNKEIKGKRKRKLQIFVFAATCGCVFKLQWTADTTVSILGRACQKGAEQEAFIPSGMFSGDIKIRPQVKKTQLEHNVNRGFGSGKPTISLRHH